MTALKDLKAPFFTVLFIFVFFYLFTKLLGPIPISVNSVTTTKTDLFTVTGEGEAKATAGSANFTVGVTKNAATAELAKNQVNQAMNDMVAAIKQLGIPDTDIQTQDLSVNPNYNFANGSQSINGYTASENLHVKATTDKANQALDAATAKGANVVNGVSFELDQADKDALEEKAREQAIQKAKAKAETIAKAAGLRLGRLVNIQESTEGQQPVPLMEKTAFGAARPADTATNLQPGENTVRLTVTLSYETL